MNSIFSDNTNYGVSQLKNHSEVAITHCLFHNNSEFDYLQFGEIKVSGAIDIDLSVRGADLTFEGDPMFAEAATGDYRLTDGSLALDRGFVEMAPPVDLEGNPRPGSDGLVDIGAYEVELELDVPPELTPPAIRIPEAPLASGESVFSVTWDAADNSGPLESVDLYFRHNGGPLHLFGSILGHPTLEVDTSDLGGDGWYDFYLFASDSSGNTREVPDTPDYSVLVASQWRGQIVYVDKDADELQLGTSWANAMNTL